MTRLASDRAGRRHHGLSLLEVVLAIAAGAVVVVGAALFYNLASAANRTDQAAQQIQFTIGNVRNLYAGVASFASMDAASLQNAKVYPPQMYGKDSSNNVVIQNPWGGNVAGAVDSTSNARWTLTYSKVPQDACAKLVAVSNTAYGGSLYDIQVKAGTNAQASIVGANNPGKTWTVTPATAATSCSDATNNTIVFYLS